MKWFKAIGWLAWFVAVAVFVQNAVASRVELQPRAALISWIIVILIVLPAALVLMRKIREKRDG